MIVLLGTRDIDDMMLQPDYHICDPDVGGELIYLAEFWVMTAPNQRSAGK